MGGGVGVGESENRWQDGWTKRRYIRGERMEEYRDWTDRSMNEGLKGLINRYSK